MHNYCIFLFSPESISSFFDVEKDGCARSINSIDFSHFDTEKLEDVSFLLRGCQSLQSVNLTNFDAPKLKYMQNMFQACENLQSVDLSSCVASNVENMKAMFGDCTKITSIDLSNIKSSKELDVESMIASCWKLQYIHMPNLYLKGKLYGMFNFNNPYRSYTLNYMDIYNTTITYIDFYNYTRRKGGPKLFICMENEIMFNFTKYINSLNQNNLNDQVKLCCNYSYEKSICNRENYIIVNYISQCSYNQGFKTNHRNSIEKIVVNNAEKEVSNSFKLEAN